MAMVSISSAWPFGGPIGAPAFGSGVRAARVCAEAAGTKPTGMPGRWPVPRGISRPEGQ